MNVFNICGVNIILFLIFSLIFDQTYKVCTRNSKSDGALTVILEFLAGLIILLLIPFFDIKFPTDIKIYILWGISIIFFAITDRINTTVRRGVEASTFNILRQISTVFILLAGILIFKEELVLKKIIGAILIIFSNILIFYEKGVFKNNKYIGLLLLPPNYHSTYFDELSDCNNVIPANNNCCWIKSELFSWKIFESYDFVKQHIKNIKNYGYVVGKIYSINTANYNLINQEKIIKDILYYLKFYNNVNTPSYSELLCFLKNYQNEKICKINIRKIWGKLKKKIFK